MITNKQLTLKIKKYLPEIFVSFLLIVLYFATRLYQLKQVPVFLDELIYGRWAQMGKYDGDLRLVSLSDGKQPLFIWLSTITMNFVLNPIAATRIVSVLSGLGTAIGLYFLSYTLYKNKWIGLLAAFFYIICPFALFFNRLGIYESLVAMLFIWSLYGEIMLVKYLRFDIALLLGLVLGLGFLNKTSGSIAIYLLPLSLLLANFNKKNWKKILLKWVALAVVAVVLAYLCSSILLLSRNYNMINEKNYLFIYHMSELIPYGAFAAWGKNLYMYLQWIVAFCSIPFLLLILCSFFYPKNRKETLLLFLWFAIPTISLALFGRLQTSRYIYPFVMFAIPLAAVGLWYLYLLLKKKIMLFIFIFFLSVIFMLYIDCKILIDLKNAPLPEETMSQYINGWSSGDGLQEMIAYITQMSQKSQIYLVTEGTYGSVPTLASEMYFMNNSFVTIDAQTYFPEQIPYHLIDKATRMQVYIFTNKIQKMPAWPIDLVLEHKKGSGNQYMRLYKVR